MADASLRDGDGFAIGCVIKIYNGLSVERVETYSEYADKEIKTTRAELIASVLGIEKAYEECPEPENYRLVVKTDCEHVARDLAKIEEDTDDKFKRIKSKYIRQFDYTLSFWISRSENQKADGIARNALESNNE